MSYFCNQNWDGIYYILFFLFRGMTYIYIHKSFPYRIWLLSPENVYTSAIKLPQIKREREKTTRPMVVWVNVPHRFQHWNTWSPVWGCLIDMALLEEVHPWGVGFEVSKLRAIPSSLSLPPAWICVTSASNFQCQQLCLLSAAMLCPLL